MSLLRGWFGLKSLYYDIEDIATNEPEGCALLVLLLALLLLALS